MVRLGVHSARGVAERRCREVSWSLTVLEGQREERVTRSQEAQGVDGGDDARGERISGTKGSSTRGQRDVRGEEGRVRGRLEQAYYRKGQWERQRGRLPGLRGVWREAGGQQERRSGGT